MDITLVSVTTCYMLYMQDERTVSDFPYKLLSPCIPRCSHVKTSQSYMKSITLKQTLYKQGVVTPISTILRAMTRVVTTYLADVSVAWARLPHFLVLYTAAAFDVTGRKTSATLSDKVSSAVIFETQAAWHLPSTTVSTVTVAQLPCRLN